MLHPQSDNIGTTAATEERIFHPAEDVRMLRKELAERLAMLYEKYGTENVTKKNSGEVITEDIKYIPVGHTCKEHLEAAAAAVLQLQNVCQTNTVCQAVLTETVKTKVLETEPLKILSPETVKTEIAKKAETADRKKNSCSRLLPVLEGMNFVFIAVGVVGVVWAALYYFCRNDISQFALPLIVAGIALITVGVSGRLIQDYINRCFTENFSAELEILR